MSNISWAVRMIRHPKEVREFGLALQAIQPIMVDPQATREEKRAALNVMVEELSERAFSLKLVAEQIITIINMKAEVCNEYPNSEAQVYGILRWLPRMRKHRGMLLVEVGRHRKEYGLD